MRVNIGNTLDNTISKITYKKSNALYIIMEELQIKVDTLLVTMEELQTKVDTYEQLLNSLDNKYTSLNISYVSHRHNYTDTTIADTADGTGTPSTETKTTSIIL